MPATRPGPDWFTGGYAEAAFERHLLNLEGPIHALQIGAYLGDASQWLLDWVLTDTGSWLVDVDTWEGSQETAHEAINFAAVHEFYLRRMRGRNVGSFQGTSDAYFDMKPAPFDFIYIDGAHTSEQVMRDAVNADQYLKVGGLLAFDDYQWWDETDPRDRPAPAIDAFVRCYEKRYEVLEMDLQVWLRKIA
jgi:predicted O-methyltransferase YrrM